MTSSLTYARLREVLDYDPETGVFRWRVCRGPRASGSMAGCPNSDHRIYIKIDGQNYLASPLAYLWMTGTLPDDQQVDHINRDPSDNRWINLRLATHSQNQANGNLYS